MIEVEVTNHQESLPVDPDRIERAVRMITEEEAIEEGCISVAVVDDPTMRRLNQRHLSHDCTTDVLSFPLERSLTRVEGEVIVSGDTARREAPRYGWSPDDELLLYVIHGALHLVGCDDRQEEGRKAMRARERACLARFGLKPRYTALRGSDSRAMNGGTLER